MARFVLLAEIRAKGASCAGKHKRVSRKKGGARENVPLDSVHNLFCLPPPMADKANKWDTNVAGKFYVDQQCIDCDLCRETAPAFFSRNDEGGYSYVSKQPSSDDETAKCMEALEGCPVEAIGNDGE